MKELLKGMTLREKIGQTAMPSPPAVRKGVMEEGGYVNYFKKYPYCGFYLSTINMLNKDKGPLKYSSELAEIAEETAAELDIPIFIAADAESGGHTIFDEMTQIPTNMAVGATRSHELAYKRTHYWAKELRAAGVNWVFGPVFDIVPHFLSTAIRCISDKTELIVDMVPPFIKGIQDAGMMATAKHYPGAKGDFRDSHFALSSSKITREEWDKIRKPIWKAAAEAGVDSFMTAHPALPAFDDSFVKGKIRRPSSASKKILGVLRDDIGFDGVIVTDAVSMKGIAAAFEHDDIYIECLNAGNDVILFTGNDYIDVIEKAVNDGRVSIERIDEAVERILNAKKNIGLFDGKILGDAMTEEDKKDFNTTNYEISKQGGTLINNLEGVIPFDTEKVKRATIIPLAVSERFRSDLKYMQDALSKYGIESEIVEGLNSKSELKAIDEKCDLIIYACFMGWAEPQGFPGFSQDREIQTLFNGLTYGAEKTVVASFGAPCIYYNYFDGFETYINMYCSTKESMEAFVDGILGKFEFTGKTPVALSPEE